MQKPLWKHKETRPVLGTLHVLEFTGSRIRMDTIINVSNNAISRSVCRYNGVRAPLDRRSAGRNAGQLAPPGSPSNLLTKIVYLAQLFHDQKLHTDSAPLKKKKWLESGIERHSALGFHNLIWGP